MSKKRCRLSGDKVKFATHEAALTRAFVRPKSNWHRIALWLRGWRRHRYGELWTKPSARCRKLCGP